MDRNKEIRANKDKMDAWETFTVEAETGGKVAIKTHFGYYLSAQKDGRLQADRSSVGDWERFTPECLGNYQTNTYIFYHSVLLSKMN